MIALTFQNWQWHSKRGTNRAENRDYGGLYIGQKYTFALVMDAMSKGSRGQAFNETWAAGVLKNLTTDVPTQDAVIGSMRQAHALLQEGKFWVERACYVALLYPHDATYPALAFVCGDCTLGISNGQTIEWISPSHTLTNACSELVPDFPGVRRELVTKALNARRFETPQIFEITNTGSQFVLATDGFHDNKSGEDDSSRLVLGGCEGSLNVSDCSNFKLRK